HERDAGAVRQANQEARIDAVCAKKCAEVVAEAIAPDAADDRGSDAESRESDRQVRGRTTQLAHERTGLRLEDVPENFSERNDVELRRHAPTSACAAMASSASFKMSVASS